MKRGLIGAAAIAAAVVGIGLKANAQLLLTPGNSGAMPATLPAGPAGFLDFYSSPNVQDAGLGFTAQADSAVTVGNSFGASALTFWYRVSNVADPATGPNPIQSMTIAMAPGGASQVALNQTGGTLNVAMSGSLSPGGAVVGFSWVGGIGPIPKGNNSSWLSVDTPFTQYRLNVVQVQDGTVVPVPALVPIPEPTTYVGLFALGLAGFAAFRRFRA